VGGRVRSLGVALAGPQIREGRSGIRRWLVGTLGLAVAYWLLGELSGVVQYSDNITVAWLPVGFAAGVLYLGDLRWFVGGVIGDLCVGNSWVPFSDFIFGTQSYVTTVGNTIEFTLAAVLLRLWLGRHNRLERPTDILLLFLAIGICTAISAIIGTLAWVQWGGAPWNQFLPSIRTWWLGDTSGGMLIAPLLIAWGAPPWRLSWRPREVALAVAILGAVVGLSIGVFVSHHPLTYLVFPALVLAAVYLGQRGATLGLLLAYVVAVAFTSANQGPFVDVSINDEALSTQLYILMATVTTLTLGAAVSARRRAAVELSESRRRESERAAEERQRIARDLHDSVSQTLFSLGLHVGIAQHEVARADLGDDSPLPAAIEEAASLAHGALLEMRASIFDLRGSAVAEQGLVAALGAHGAALAVRHDVEVTVDGPAERLTLAPEAEELLFRIGQEAITNAVKHSGSARVDVEVSAHGAIAELTVRDHGRGFDTSRSYGGHLGLELMRSRAVEAGGSLVIESVLGAGTTVRATAPMTATAAVTPDARERPAAPPASVT
jgi:signal transduction histidine kinase